MSSFSETADQSATMDNHGNTSVSRRSRDKPEESNVTSLRTLAGLYLSNEAHAFFEELQADLSSIKIQGDNVDWLWCMLDWQRYIIGLWMEQMKKKSPSTMSWRKWVDIKESWEVIIQTTVSLNLSYASPSSVHQRQTCKADAKSLRFGETLCGNSSENGHESFLAEEEMVLVDSILRATEEEEWTTPFFHEKAFTRLIESTMDNLASTHSPVQLQQQRRSGITSSMFQGFTEVLDKEIKNLIALSPAEEQEQVYVALDRTLRTALLKSKANVDTNIRYLTFYQSLISAWPFNNDTLAIGIECIFQDRVQELFGKIISSPYNSSRPQSFPYTMKDLDDVLGLGADIRGVVKGRHDCALWTAATFSNWPYFNALIHAGAPYTMEPKLDRSPLQAAIGAGNPSIVAFLLDSKQHHLEININHADRHGRTALHEAARNCNDSVIRLLLQQSGIDVNPSDDAQYTPFLHAVEAVAVHPKKYASIKIFLGDKRVDYNVKRFHATNALHLAAMSRDATLKIITGHVKGVNDQDDCGKTPLHHAVACNSRPNVEILLSQGADPTVSSIEGSTPLLLACHQLHLGPMKLLLSLPGSLKYQWPKSIIRLQHNYNETGTHGSPVALVLHYYERAGKRRRAHIILALRTVLAAKPDLQMRNDLGQTVLNYLIESVDEDVVLELLQAGANVNTQDNNGRTPLHQLMKSDVAPSSEKVELLLKWGADIDLKDKDGHAALTADWVRQEEKLLRVINKDRTEKAKARQQKQLDLLAKQTKAYVAKQKETKKSRPQASSNPFAILPVEGAELGQETDDMEPASQEESR